MDIDWKDVLIRSFKTFWQAGVSYIVVTLPNMNLFDGSASKKVWLGFAVAAVSAGASAAWNGAIKPAWDKFMSSDTL